MAFAGRRARFDERPRTVAIAALFAAYAMLATGCSDLKPTDSDDATSPVDGAIAGDEDTASTIDADSASTSDAATDGTSDVDGAGCQCSLVDLGVPPVNGVFSLPCYCAHRWPLAFGIPACSSYEDAVRCDQDAKSLGIEFYTNCNLVTVHRGTSEYDARVFDATTHELVGAYRQSDNTMPCEDAHVFVIRGGVVPFPDCQVDHDEYPCLDGGTSAQQRF